VKVKMLIGIAGRWEPQAGSVYIDVKRGDVVDIPEEAAYRHAAHGQCQLDWKAEPGQPGRLAEGCCPGCGFHVATQGHRDFCRWRPSR
jgi:hypothetical protein